jgi:hypothetical protein
MKAYSNRSIASASLTALPSVPTSRSDIHPMYVAKPYTTTLIGTRMEISL